MPLPLQVWPPWQTWLQLPQLSLSLVSLVQKVLGAVPQRLGALAGHWQ
jgi:hypothetical protein